MSGKSETSAKVIEALERLPAAEGRKNRIKPMAMLILASDTVGVFDALPRHAEGAGTKPAIAQLEEIAEQARSLHNLLRKLGPIAQAALENEISVLRAEANAAKVVLDKDPISPVSWSRPPHDLAIIEYDLTQLAAIAKSAEIDLKDQDPTQDRRGPKKKHRHRQVAYATAKAFYEITGKLPTAPSHNQHSDTSGYGTEHARGGDFFNLLKAVFDAMGLSVGVSGSSGDPEHYARDAAREFNAAHREK